MSLVTLKEILADAKKRQYAVGGFNVFNFETLCAVVEVAEELKAPLVLGIAERLFKFVDVDTLSAAMVRAATKSSVPVAIHLDHARTYEGIIKALRWGFTSVMFGRSALSFADNLKQTKDIAKLARSLGISVEGEIGYRGNVGNVPAAEGAGNDKLITLEMAAQFVEKTKIDALAIDITADLKPGGKSAGVDLSWIGELSGAVNVPLVLHGGSKLSKNDYKNVVKSGIAKINIATDMSLVAGEAVRNEISSNPTINYINLMALVKKGVKDSVRKYMINFDCISKANGQ